MKLVGLAEIVAFTRDHPRDAEMVRAWVYEMKIRRWDRPEAVVSNHHRVDVSRLPAVIFQLASAPVQIETLIDFRNNIVLLTNIHSLASEDNRLSIQHGIS